MDEDGVDRILGQWARERPELGTEAMGILGRLNRTSAAAQAAMERTCAEFGISRGDYDVLATLRRSGEPFSLTPGALSNALMLTTGGMTGRLHRLEQRGLIARSPDPNDRRGLRVTLTREGREVIDQAVQAGVETQERLLARLAPEQRRQLDALLRELLAGAASWVDGP